MYTLLILEVIFTLALYTTGRMANLDDMNVQDNETKLYFLLPIGFQLMKLVRHKYKSRYERRLEAKLRELGDSRDAHAALKVFIAQKCVCIIGALIFVTLIGTQSQPDISYVIFALGFPILLFYIMDRQIDRRVLYRRSRIKIEFSEFLNKLVLIVNAGMTVSAAIQKIINDSSRDTPLYRELARTINDMASGKPETQSYEDLARRCRIQEVTVFTAILLQNLRKGNTELVPILRMQSVTCWENRRNAARKLGEEASTKLVFPMMIIFIAIIIMVMAPAIMQMNI